MKRVELLLDRPCGTEGPRFEPRANGRFCHHCREMQYDLRDATRSEVIALVSAHGGRICGQLRLGPSGAPKFKPEPPVRTLDVLRSAAVAVALAACGSPPEASGAPEPTTTAAPPTTTPEAALADGIDHSTDTSTDPADHQTHVHTHAPVAVDDPQGLGTLGGIGLGHPEYNGGVGISTFQHGGVGTGRP